MTARWFGRREGRRLRGKADHLDKLRERLDEGEQAVGASSASREALLQRLKMLPPSHPSSIRTDGRGQVPKDGSPENALSSAEPDRPGRPDGSDRSDRQGGADAPRVGFWEKVEHFQSLWQAHLARWPDKPRATDRDRSDDPPGSWRGDGDRYLSPENNAEAGKVIALLREPEEAITELLKQIHQDNPHGGHLVGLEHRLKGDDRLKEKIVDELAGEAGTSIADAASRVSDAIRYTSCFAADEYVDGYGGIVRQLESAGCEMTYGKNRWLDDPQYKGVNTRWQTPSGARFELQFHIPESFYAKEHLTHRSYDRLRSLETSRSEKRRLNAYERAVIDAVPVPTRITEILDTGVRQTT